MVEWTQTIGLHKKKFIERRGNLFLEGKRVEVIVREREEL